jgi:hypothetical protein
MEIVATMAYWERAGVAELADARDSKTKTIRYSAVTNGALYCFPATATRGNAISRWNHYRTITR